MSLSCRSAYEVYCLHVLQHTAVDMSLISLPEATHTCTGRHQTLTCGWEDEHCVMQGMDTQVYRPQQPCMKAECADEKPGSFIKFWHIKLSDTFHKLAESS